MKKFSVLFSTALLAGTAFAASAKAGDELTITSWGGAYQDSQRKAYYEPYSAAGNKITEAEYNGEVAKIKAMVEANAITWDVIDVDSATALQGCAEGALETIDWAKLGLDKAKFLGSDVSECSVPTIVYSTVIGYDTSKLAEGPTSINDLYDLAKFPGKRALQKNPTVNLEWALIADGVLRLTLQVLATQRCRPCLQEARHHQERNYLVEAGAQAPQLLADGQLCMTSPERPACKRQSMLTKSRSRSCGIIRRLTGIVGDHKAHQARRSLSLRRLRFGCKASG